MLLRLCIQKSDFPFIGKYDSLNDISRHNQNIDNKVLNEKHQRNVWLTITKLTKKQRYGRINNSKGKLF